MIDRIRNIKYINFTIYRSIIFTIIDENAEFLRENTRISRQNTLRIEKSLDFLYLSWYTQFISNFLRFSAFTLVQRICYSSASQFARAHAAGCALSPEAACLHEL